SASVALLAASTLSVAPPDPATEAIPAPVTAAFGAVVSVRVHEVVRIPVFRGGRFLREPVEGIGAGSGVVVAQDGLILTNAHVVAGATSVDVATVDGRNLSARVVSQDESSDLALLKTEGGRFHPLELAGNDLPAPGAPLYVLGNLGDRGPQLGWARMGRHRRVRVGARPLEFWAEVEAPVGPGNSGGAI